MTGIDAFVRSHISDSHSLCQAEWVSECVEGGFGINGDVSLGISRGDDGGDDSVNVVEDEESAITANDTGFLAALAVWWLSLA